MLKVRGLRKEYAGQRPRVLFDDLNLDLARGELIAVMGESGSGKSTLLNLLAGLDRADAGTIEIEQRALGSLTIDQRARLRRERIGFVFQAFHLLPYLTVADNAGLPLLLQGQTARQRNAAVMQALAEVGLAERASAWPRELSGGEMQRVAIARALVHRPALVLADEPTGNLDAELAGQILELLRRAVEQRGAACILVTHSPTAARIADRIYLLANGVLRAHA